MHPLWCSLSTNLVTVIWLPVKCKLLSVSYNLADRWWHFTFNNYIYILHLHFTLYILADQSIFLTKDIYYFIIITLYTSKTVAVNLNTCIHLFTLQMTNGFSKSFSFKSKLLHFVNVWLMNQKKSFVVWFWATQNHKPKIMNF